MSVACNTHPSVWSVQATSHARQAPNFFKTRTGIAFPRSLICRTRISWTLYLRTLLFEIITVFQRPRFHIYDIQLPRMVKQIGNVYLIAGIAIIGGGLFGFDISSMSAM